VEVSASLHNQILFGIKAFYAFLKIRDPAALFDTVEKPRSYAPDGYQPFLAHVAARKPRRKIESRSDASARAALAKRAADRRLTSDQVLRIIEAAALMRDAFLVVVLYTTGLRIGEARSLLHEDIRLDENLIWVTPRDLENGKAQRQGFSHIPIGNFRKTEATWISEAFQSGGDVHAVPEQIAGSDHHGTDMHSDPKLKAAF
jgi:integrase